MNRDVRRHASRLLEHATASADAPSAALRIQALRYAKLSALKLCAVVEVGYLEEQLSEAAYRVARECLRRVLAELSVALPPERGLDEPTAPSAPSETDSRSEGTASTFDEVALEDLSSGMSRLETIPAIGTG